MPKILESCLKIISDVAPKKHIELPKNISVVDGFFWYANMVFFLKVMIPVLENLDPENANGAHHYWVLNINLRDKRFEVFDSWRMLKKSKRLDDVARDILAAVRVLWDKYYPKQAKTMDKFPLVDINGPKQTVS